MALIDRLARLLKADIHAVMDRIEEPRQLLRCAIRDMEDELQQLEHGHQRDLERARDLRASIDERTRVLGDLESELDIAFAADRDDLARCIVQKKLATDLDCRQLQAELDRLDDRIARSATLSAERTETVAELRREADRRIVVGDAVARGTVTTVHFSDADVDIALMREQDARRPA